MTENERQAKMIYKAAIAYKLGIISAELLVIVAKDVQFIDQMQEVGMTPDDAAKLLIEKHYPN